MLHDLQPQPPVPHHAPAKRVFPYGTLSGAEVEVLAEKLAEAYLRSIGKEHREREKLRRQVWKGTAPSRDDMRRIYDRAELRLAIVVGAHKASLKQAEKAARLLSNGRPPILRDPPPGSDDLAF
ncbi:MAG TPA: hypothetical protein VGU24_15235 [Microvirga sp.]|nr:hypothetical protein [Microvirga sp.]